MSAGRIIFMRRFRVPCLCFACRRVKSLFNSLCRARLIADGQVDRGHARRKAGMLVMDLKPPAILLLLAVFWLPLARAETFYYLVRCIR